PGIFAVDVERPASGGPGDKVVGLLGKAIHGMHLGEVVHAATHRVEVFQERLTIFELVDGQAGRQVQVLHGEIGSARVATGRKGVVLHAQKVATEITGVEPDTAGVRHGRVSGNARLAGAEL